MCCNFGFSSHWTSVCGDQGGIFHIQIIISFFVVCSLCFIKCQLNYIFAEYRGTRICHFSKCMCHGLCNYCWWISGLQSRMARLWASCWVIGCPAHAFLCALLLSIFFLNLSLIDRYFPYGVDGMLAGASTVFFAYIGFDSVASTAEEVLPKSVYTLLPLFLFVWLVLTWYIVLE